jgi:ElaB/YqjD/DUF883 family membrane-anchored ribosome-binding protein
MNEQQHVQSSRHYEREAEATRHRLAQRLDDLSGRLTPGQVFDEMLTYARGGSGTFLRAFSNAARENPIPTFLIGAGCMMFLSEKMGLGRYVSRGGGDGAPSKTMSSKIGGAVSRVESGLGSVTGAARSGAQIATEFAGEQASNLAGTVGERASAAGDAISEASQRVKEKADDLRDQTAGAVERMSEGTQNLAASVQEQIDQASRQTAETARQVKEQVTSFVNEQPFLCAALGLAAGAALAAVLPATKREHELMGPASDAVKGAIGATASESIEAAKGVAGRVAQNAIGAAEREGLTPAAAADAARNISDKVKGAVSEAGRSELGEMGRDRAK